MQAPRGGVMIGIPTSFTRSILEQVVTRLFSEMTLTLKNLEGPQGGGPGPGQDARRQANGGQNTSST